MYNFYYYSAVRTLYVTHQSTDKAAELVLTSMFLIHDLYNI